MLRQLHPFRLFTLVKFCEEEIKKFVMQCRPVQGLP
jgi:hypothetical protein